MAYQQQVPELAARLARIGVPFETWSPELHALADFVVANYTSASTIDAAKNLVRGLSTRPPELRVVALAWVNERYAQKGWTGGAAGMTLPDGTTVIATKNEESPLITASRNLAPNVLSPLPPAAPPPPPPSTIIPAPSATGYAPAPVAQPAAVPVQYSRVAPVPAGSEYQAPIYEPAAAPELVSLPLGTGVRTLYTPEVQVTGALPAASGGSNMLPLVIGGALVVAAIILAR